jgi:hypothetical protein
MYSRLAQSRLPTKNRKPTGFSNPANEQFKTYPAPLMGWVTNQNLLAQDKASALVLDNFYPTETGISPRGGLVKFVTIPARCEYLMEYAGVTSLYFAATETAIYRYDDSDSGVNITSADITGQSSSNYSHVNLINSGGRFLKIVNGVNQERLFNGTSWSIPTITGISTALLSHVWLYGKRAFYIEKDTMNAWYLGVDAIQGAATLLPLTSIFSEGGSLLFGTTFSTDTGSGLDDLCVFVTTNGEVALYSGNPADDTWTLQGVFNIGKPIGKNAFFHVGGDPIIATKEGLIPLSSSFKKDRSQAKLDSFSYAIEPTYNLAVIESGNFSRWIVQKFSVQDKLLIAPPLNSSTGRGDIFVKNLKTNAWCRYTNWSPASLAVMNDTLWIGDNNGNIFKADVGGLDDAQSFECKLAYAFDNLIEDGRVKQITRGKETWRYRTDFFSKISVATDYATQFPTPPNVVPVSEKNSSKWDVSPWDTTPWGGGDQAQYKIREIWGNLNAVGENFSIQVQVVSGSTTKLDLELISLSLGFRVGYNLA